MDVFKESCRILICLLLPLLGFLSKNQGMSMFSCNCCDFTWNVSFNELYWQVVIVLALNERNVRISLFNCI